MQPYGKMKYRQNERGKETPESNTRTQWWKSLQVNLCPNIISSSF